MTYKIEGDVPIPTLTLGHKSPEREALDKLQPGDSVVFPPDKVKTARTAAENKHAKDKEWNFVSRKQPDGTTRIWRLT